MFIATPHLLLLSRFELLAFPRRFARSAKRQPMQNSEKNETWSFEEKEFEICHLKLQLLASCLHFPSRILLSWSQGRRRRCRRMLARIGEDTKNRNSGFQLRRSKNSASSNSIFMKFRSSSGDEVLKIQTQKIHELVHVHLIVFPPIKIAFGISFLSKCQISLGWRCSSCHHRIRLEACSFFKKKI